MPNCLTIIEISLEISVIDVECETNVHTPTTGTIKETDIHSVAISFSTPVQPNVIQYNCYAIKFTFMMPAMFLLTLS